MPNRWRNKKLPVSGRTFCNTSRRSRKQPNEQATKPLATESPSSTVADDLCRFDPELVNFQSTHFHDDDEPADVAVSERGLPSEEALRDLARTYLTLQGQLWPELLKAGSLPRVKDLVVAEYAADFRRRFLSGFMEDELTSELASSNLAAAYLRYSCDHSNPRSLDQQLHNALHRARQDNAFIPWYAVCADAAVSGTIANRRGYQLAKHLLVSPKSRISRLYIDEMGRASRDAIEALKLGRLIQQHNKRLIGVTDGFDSAHEQSRMTLHMYAMMQEWFVAQLREKVDRGMRDAFERGDVVHNVCFGYKLVPRMDENGKPVIRVIGKHKKVMMDKVIDDSAAPWVEFAYTHFVVHRWSPHRIARHFLDHNVGGMQTWDHCRITTLLKRKIYVGIEQYRLTKKVIDPDSGGSTHESRPKEDTLERKSPRLRIISDELHAQALQLLEQNKARKKKIKRKVDANGEEAYPKRLFRPMCKYCKKPLYAARGGKYASYQCHTGCNRQKRCKLKSCKSVRIFETCILDFIRDTVITEEFVDRLVVSANMFLVQAAARPRQDTKPLEDRLRHHQRACQRLMKILRDRTPDNLTTLVDEMERNERQIVSLKRQLSEIEAQNAPPPPPLTKKEVMAQLEHLRELLNQDVGAAATVLRKLTGPIVVEQGEAKSKRGKSWIARFTINAVPALVELASHKHCPSSGTLEYLHTAGWTMPIGAEVPILKVPNYELLAPKFKALKEQGVSTSKIAHDHGMSHMYATEIIEFARTGVRPKWKSGKRTGTGIQVKHTAIRERARHLRFVEKRKFPAIRWQLALEGHKVSEATIRRACYDKAAG